MWGSWVRARSGDVIRDGTSDKANPPPYSTTHKSATPSAVLLQTALIVTPQVTIAASSAATVATAIAQPASDRSSCNTNRLASSDALASTTNVTSTLVSRLCHLPRKY